MGNCKRQHPEGEYQTTTTVQVDVTKIVKYSCISSVLIVLIIFASKVIRQMFLDE